MKGVEEAYQSLSDPPSPLELQGLAAYVHQFYTGVEGLFRHLVVRLGEGLPRGEQWPRELLAQVAEPHEGKRPAIIDEPLRALLEEYLAFRHFFRHAYGYQYQLEWPRLRPLVVDLPSTFQRLQAGLEAFFAALHPTHEEREDRGGPEGEGAGNRG